MGKHHEKTGNQNAQIGKFGIGFNAAVSSVSRVVGLSSRQPKTGIVNMLRFNDMHTEVRTRPPKFKDTHTRPSC